MRELPRQPKNLDPIDEASLAAIGHRIETWEIMKDTGLPFAARRINLMHAMEKEMEVFEQKEGELPPEYEALMEDFEEVRTFDGSEDAFLQMCEEKMHYYSEVRKEFIGTLG
jgi:hypothetical protein